MNYSMSRKVGICVVLGVVVLAVAGWAIHHAFRTKPVVPSPEGEGDDSLQRRFVADVRPFLDRHCTSCHGGSKPEASLDLSREQTVSAVVVRTAPGSGTIGTWRVVNNDTGAVLKTGSGAGTITFSATSLRKINLEITSASGTPRIAELETYAG